ncbi:ATP-binding cassette sub-family B member 8, mitochondrial-like [Centruroides sculpturatus]|uniref:ATP-binding cassette sub-family B member 8, mitochondrial-like n=1 Tax=Centruroides sculpturatus TaxID=218467 RepID=UPI000C6CFD14|nr:ATP-binding cassette sub-family B member 8, mitochondrial-like [Centruroides sculpturatus]
MKQKADGKFLIKFSSSTLITWKLVNQRISVSCEVKAEHKSRLFGIDKDIMQETKFDWKQFFDLLKPEIWHMIIAVLSAIAVAYYNIQIPVLLGDVVNVVSRFVSCSGQTEIGNFFQQIKNPCLRLLHIYLAQSFFTFLYISMLSYSGERIAYNIKKSLFNSVIKQDIAFFDAHKTGEILSRLTSDVQEFKSSLKLCISYGLRSITQAFGCVVSLYFISPKLTTLLIIVMPTVIGSGTVIASFLRKWSKLSQEQVARAAAVADEAIGNVRTVRAFAMEDKEIELYDQEILKAQKLNAQLGVGIGAFQGVTNLVLNGIILGVLFTGGFLMSSQEITPGSLMSFLVATQTVQKSLAQLSQLFGYYIRGIAAGSRIFQYMNMEPTHPLRKGKIIPKEELKGDVIFNNVTFHYPTRPYQNVLTDFSLHVPSGKIVAICGLSGGGKSTVAALLERFYDVSSGSILLDGYDIKTLDPSWLREEVIGFISQEPVLFATSIMENIRYGHPNATDEEVVNAAKLANADDFICSFPHGYHTVLGERGVTVSGGQKQRIAIARALIKDPKILILDEATSALDAESEKVVQETLDRVIKGRTVLVIAHRLSTIQNANIIAVLSHGIIAELGSHKMLRKKRGLYWELIRQQHEFNENPPSVEN